MRRVTYNLPNHAHYLTFSCYRRQQLLTSDDLRSQLLRVWDEARRSGNFAIWSYVIMPEHVHLLIYPRGDDYKVSDILRRLKEPFTRWVVAYWLVNDPDSTQEGDTFDITLIASDGSSEDSVDLTVYVQPYVCGDADGSGEVDIDDAIFILYYVFPRRVTIRSADRLRCAQNRLPACSCGYR